MSVPDRTGGFEDRRRDAVHARGKVDVGRDGAGHAHRGVGRVGVFEEAVDQRGTGAWNRTGSGAQCGQAATFGVVDDGEVAQVSVRAGDHGVDDPQESVGERVDGGAVEHLRRVREGQDQLVAEVRDVGVEVGERGARRHRDRGEPQRARLERSGRIVGGERRERGCRTGRRARPPEHGVEERWPAAGRARADRLGDQRQRIALQLETPPDRRRHRGDYVGDRAGGGQPDRHRQRVHAVADGVGERGIRAHRGGHADYEVARVAAARQQHRVAGEEQRERAHPQPAREVANGRRCASHPTAGSRCRRSRYGWSEPGGRWGAGDRRPARG